MVPPFFLSSTAAASSSSSRGGGNPSGGGGSASGAGGSASGGGGREPSTIEEEPEPSYAPSTSPGTGADSEGLPGGHINDRQATGGSSSGSGLGLGQGQGSGQGSGWGKGLGIAFGQRRTYLETHEGGDVYTVAFHPEGRYLASGGADGTVAVHDVVAATCIKQFTGHAAAVTHVTYNAHGNYVVSSSKDG